MFQQSHLESQVFAQTDQNVLRNPKHLNYKELVKYRLCVDQIISGK